MTFFGRGVLLEYHVPVFELRSQRNSNPRNAKLTPGSVIVTRRVGIETVITAPRSPWQNPYVERLVGSVRRECLDHLIVLGERHLHRILKSYFAYCHKSRTHLSLYKDAPEPRAVQPPSKGRRGRRGQGWSTYALAVAFCVPMPISCPTRGALVIEPASISLTALVSLLSPAQATA
jgi:hypothetical protein